MGQNSLYDEAITKAKRQSIIDREDTTMTWNLFFITVGITYITAQLFRLIDLIEGRLQRR